MEDPEQHLLPKFRGTVLGAAMAEALAFPYKHYSRLFLSSMVGSLTAQYAVHHSGRHPRGQYGDKTQLMLAVMASILEERGVSAEGILSHMIPLWRDNLLVDAEPSTAQVLKGAVKGQRRTGLPVGRAEAAPTARVIGIALWEHTDFEKLLKGVKTCTRVTHEDPRPLACSAAVAAAIATNAPSKDLRLGLFLDQVAGAASRFDSTLGEAILDFPRVLSMNEWEALRFFEDLSTDNQYPSDPEGIGDYCIPATCIALYYFLKSPYRYDKVIDRCLRVGGQMDVTAFVAGAISGAFLGETELPANLAEELLNVEEIASSALELYNAWLKKP